MVFHDQDDSNARKGKWTAEEDAMLAAYIARHGEGKWKMVEKRAGVNRSAQCCRLRWTSHLHSSLKKGPLTPEEELTILELHEQIGNKWARIALQLPGRTDTHIKNYVNNLIRKGERAREKAAERLASSWKHTMTYSPPQRHGEGFETTLSSDYRPNAGKLYGGGISDQRGAQNSYYGMLMNRMTEFAHHPEGLSMPNMPVEQPQYINNTMESIYNNINYDDLCAHADDHLRMSGSVNDVDGNIQAPSMSDTSIVVSTFSSARSPPPQESSEMMQYYEADQSYALDLDYSSSRNSSQGDMSHLQVACSHEPRNLELSQTVPYDIHPGDFDEIFSDNLGPSDVTPASPASLHGQTVPYDQHPGDFDEIFFDNLGPSNATPASLEFPFVHADPFLNYGATHTHAENSLQFYVPSQNPPWN